MLKRSAGKHCRIVITSGATPETEQVCQKGMLIFLSFGAKAPWKFKLSRLLWAFAAWRAWSAALSPK